MHDWIFDLLTGPQAYAVVFAVAAADALVPVVPSESSLILAGVLSADARGLDLGWVVVAAAVGAFAGDNAAYALGRYGCGWFVRWLSRRKRGRALLAGARTQLDRRGAVVIVVGRFIPGGRTAVTLTAGMTAYSYRRFASFTALAASLWAINGAVLGHFGGRVFHDHAWLAFLAAFAVAAALAAAGEAFRRVREKQAPSRPPEEELPR
jgi:membrane-associated protein